jgi:O-antigen/teichoic acid export membrane protein
MSLARRIGWSTAGQLAGRLYTSTLAFLITALVLPRFLSIDDFGVFAFHLTLYQLLANVLDFGAGNIVVREASRDRERAGRLIGMLVRLKAQMAVPCVALLLAVAWIFEGPGERFVILAIAAMHMFFHAPGGASAIFHVDMAFGRAIMATILGQTAWLLATAALVLSMVDRPAPFLLAYGLGPLVNGVCVYLWARRRVDIRYDADREQRRRLWHQAWPAGLSMAMASVYFYIDTIMLRPMVGEAGVAYYSVAYRLMAFVLMVPVLFSQVVLPVFSRLWSLSPRTLSPFFQRCTLTLLSIGIVFPATVPFVRADVMDVVYPASYAPGADSLGILSLAIVLVFAAYPHMTLLLAANLQRTMMFISMTGAGLNIALNLLWVPRLGIEGAAWATVATEAFVLGAAVVACARRTGQRFDLRPFGRAFACALGASAVLAITLPMLTGSWVRLGVGVLTGLVAVVASGMLPLDLGTEEGAP